MKGKSGILPPYDKEFVGVAILTYKGICMDIFLDTCGATRWVHESAVIINKRKFVSMECLAYFKLFAIDEKNSRYYKDMDDLTNIVCDKAFQASIVESRLVKVFGENSKQVETLRSLVQKKKARDSSDSWWEGHNNKQ
jgi:hypothetical protein